jgi:hypothetical protein
MSLVEFLRQVFFLKWYPWRIFWKFQVIEIDEIVLGVDSPRYS